MKVTLIFILAEKTTVLCDTVLERSNQKCELYSSKNEIDVFTVSPKQ